MSAAPAEFAVQLPWLAPGVAALAALAHPTRPAAWPTVRTDPAALLLLFRQSNDTRATVPSLDRLAPAAAANALTFLTPPATGILDRTQPIVRTVLTSSLRIAHVARHLAVCSRQADPEAAWSAGLLAPLGWLAVAAVQPTAVAECASDVALRLDPCGTQTAHWGLSAAQITRRLARRWELPRWLAAVIGHLDLPLDLATAVGADLALLAITQAAVSLAARPNDALHFGLGTPLPAALAHLGLELETATASIPPESPSLAADDGNPYAAPWLADLLALAVDNHDQPGISLIPRLETEIDELHRLLLSQRAGETERLRVQKLAALAEFAAGAGHEINNPLAVISGQAQYLLGQESEPARQKALRAVIQQAQRIHQILTDVMHFARPSRPQKQTLDVRDIILGVAAGLDEWAAQREVRVELALPDGSCPTEGDAKQLHTALNGLLRNAIEAAPAGGWARVRIESSDEHLRVVVEDSGPGPTPAQVEHLFDPFFSGRPAGRGCGMGLSTAWRLAREQGGDVCFEPLADGPTKFVLSLPRVRTLTMPQLPDRLSA